jgi:hypothetical protein
MTPDYRQMPRSRGAARHIFAGTRLAPRPIGRAYRDREAAMPAAALHVVEGYVGRGFEDVRRVFDENFAARGELGGACCAFVDGEKAVDLWGGLRDARSGAPWQQDTMVIVYSTT